MLSSVLCIALFETVVNALAHDLPRQTLINEEQLREAHRIPKPTAAPQVPPELRRRQDDLTTAFIGPDQTCGFISGLAGAGYNCDASDYCVLYPATATGFGSVACCDSVTNDCAVVTACIDSSDYYSTTSLCDNGCRLDTNTLKCTESAQPYCNSVRFPDAGVEDYLCDSVSISSYQLAYITFDGENTLDDGRSWHTETYNADGYFADATTTYSNYNAISLTGAYPSGPSGDTSSSSMISKFSSPSSSSSTTASASSSVVGASATSSTSGLSHLSEKQKSSTPVGAIVGGVVGGLALIALVAAGAFIGKRKYKRNDSDSSISNPPLTYGNSSGNSSSNIHRGASEMDATRNTPMQQHEFYNPAAAQQAYSPSSSHQYKPVSSNEIPVFQVSQYQDETFLTPSPDLGRTRSTAGVSLMTTNEASPTSPTPTFNLPANIVEAPGSYEYLEPKMMNPAHGTTAHGGHATETPSGDTTGR